MTTEQGEYRDSSNKRLADYPHPSMAVDTAVLTVAGGRLHVALDVSEGDRRLPGTFLHEGEVLLDAVVRSLADKVGVRGIEARQLRVFDRLGRDRRGWVLSAAHVAVVQADHLPDDPRLALQPVDDIGRLEYDHDEIIRKAVAWLREEYADKADPLRLLGEEFTLLELQQIHEAVGGVPLTKDSFRRRMTRRERVAETGRVTTGAVGKPARYFRRT